MPLIDMTNKSVELADVVYEYFKYFPEWKNRNHLVIYSKEKVQLETGEEREIIAEYKTNRAEFKKKILARL